MSANRIYRPQPSTAAIKRFAEQFNRHEWDILCHSSQFMDWLMTDLTRAALYATGNLRRRVCLYGESVCLPNQLMLEPGRRY